MKREQEIFEEAVAQPSREARDAYLLGACGLEGDLRRSVDELLAAFDDAGKLNFLGSNGAGREARTVVSTADLQEGPGTVIGHYKLLQAIGEGGMGVVYMAEQQEPVRRRTALKIIKPGMDTRSVIARFEAERQALATMDHPNIAKVLDGGATETGRPYFVMELVRGVKITEYCDEARLSTAGRLGLFIRVCQAIQHAHQKGIIHRDIKPSNILVTLNDGVAVPKVIDFGIAKATEGRLTDKTLFTQFDALLGTPAYMSPEQAVMSSLDIDTRSDIYSLGVLLYELLTGRTPFDAKELLASGIDAMRRTIREQEPVRPSTRFATLQGDEPTTTAKRRSADTAKWLHQLRGDLDWIVMKCLEKDRTRRYETANGLAADLERHLSHEPVVARPPSTAYRLRKAWQRNRLAFTAGAVVAIVLAVGSGVSTWQAVVATRARKASAQAQTKAEAEHQRAEAQARKASESEQQARCLLYASDMNLAQQSLEQNNLGQARRLLDRHRPRNGEEDLRGWEWRYLWQLTRSSAFVTLTNRPTTRGFSVSFSPDGSRLAAGWYDGRVDLWDVPGQRWVGALTDHEQPYMGYAVFSPVRNLLAATSGPKVVRLYDLDSGRESNLWKAPEEGAWSIRCLSFSQDGSRVVISARSSTHSLGGAVWVVNVSSALIEGRYPTSRGSEWSRTARVSPDHRFLYLRGAGGTDGDRIQCLDLATGKQVWKTERHDDLELTALAISPDGRVLASGSGYADPSIRVWDAATGRLLARLDGHTGWVGVLEFTKDGRRLISAATDQTIRLWDTVKWTEIQVLRGHTDEIHAVAVSESARLVASAGKDGNLMLWKDDGKSATDGYRRLPEDLKGNQVVPLDQSRVLLLPQNKPPELIDLEDGSIARSLPELGASTNVLGWFGTNILCRWNGTNQILVHELRGAEIIQRGTITPNSGRRPAGVAYDATRQLLAWSEGTSSSLVHVAGLATPGRRIELRSDAPDLVRFLFGEDGHYLAALSDGPDSPLRVWDLETGQIVVAINERVHSAAFTASGQRLAVNIAQGPDHEIRFYNLTQLDRPPTRYPGRHSSWALAVAPDGQLVASGSAGSLVRLFDGTRGKWIQDLHGHMMGVSGVGFSPDGSRLISTAGGRETVKLWDVGTRQELLTLGGSGSDLGMARWSADGDVILVGEMWHPWQAWRAPSWDEIAAAEAKDELESRRP